MWVYHSVLARIFLSMANRTLSCQALRSSTEKPRACGTTDTATACQSNNPLSIPSALKRVVNAFVLQGIGGACLIASAAFIHLLGRGELVEGYMSRSQASGYYCRHYWARVDGVDYDVGSAITRRLAPQIELAGHPVLLQHPPLEGEQLEDPRELFMLERGYQTYMRSPQALLRCAPKWMRSEFGF